MHVEYVDHMGTDLTVCNRARFSFGKASGSLSERDIKLINFLAKHQHMTPFEHCALSVHIKCPLFIRSQIMRHRTFAYSEQSRRYTSDNIEFYTPPVWKQQAKDNRQASDAPLSEIAQEDTHMYYRDALEGAHNYYNTLLSQGVSREQARMILPQSTYTQFIMTGNLRNWHHFISLRTGKGAQEEAQWIANEIRMLLTVHFPVSMAALTAAVKSE